MHGKIMSQKSILLLLLCHFASLAQSEAERLKFVNSNTSLPSGRSGAPAAYDGDNSIYIFGGFDKLDEIVKYSLDTDSVRVVARFDCDVEVGTAVAVGASHGIVHFGGSSSRCSNNYSYIANISLYSPTTNSVDLVGQLPQPIGGAAAVWDPADRVVYIIGGSPAIGTYLDTVYRYNSNNHEVEQVAQLIGGLGFAAATWDATKRVTYVFGGYNGEMGSTRDIFEYNPSTGAVSLLPERLPHDVVSLSAAAVNEQSYIISNVGLIRFSHETHEVELLDVEMWPFGLSSAGTVYVPKIDRLYIFGGYRGDDGLTGEISYVDLSISEAPTTTEGPPPADCSDGQTRLIPDRFCCGSFYLCYAGEATKYECPEAKHFSPIKLTCADKDEVGCEVTYKIVEHI